MPATQRFSVEALDPVGLAEFIRDTIAATLVQGANVTLSVDDDANTITIATSGTTDPEIVRDTIAAALVAGPGISISVDDAGDTITITNTGGGSGGGGGSVRNVDDPADPSWGAASAYDVEFDTDGSSLPAGWSWVNQGTSTFGKRFGAGVITPQVGAGVDGGQRMIVRNLPSESSWTATLKIGNGGHRTQWSFTGMVLRESATGKYTILARKPEMTAARVDMVAAHNWSATGVYAGTAGDAFLEGLIGVRYLRVERNADGTYNLKASVDGIGWTTVQKNRAAYAAYDQIGFFCSAPGGAVDNEHTFHWFRVR